MANTYELIQAQTLTSDAASVSFTSIPNTYTDLQLLVSARINRTGVAVNMGLRFNSNSTGYLNLQAYADFIGSSASALYSAGLDQFGYWYTAGNGATASTFTNQSVYISDYASSKHKTILIDSASENNAIDASALFMSGLWSNTSAITTITLTNFQGDNLRANSTFYLYGIKNS